MSEYKIVMSELLGPGLIRIEEDGQIYGIPFDENNSDYKKYLEDTDGGLSIDTSDV